MTDPDGLLADRYRLVHRLAVGGMSTVWQGWDERLQRPVAIKQLHTQLGVSAEDAEIAVERARREARITARLHHPNAVEVLDIVDDNGRPALVMQYVASRSLQAIVRESGRLPAEQVARIGTQIAAALAAAHREGIVHRDVKPGNVLIADDGVAMLTDFGISHAHGDMSLTSTGLMTGTPAYLAPEIARGATSTPASDVFSLGATLYMALEGAPPFGTDQNAMDMLHRVASGVMNPPTNIGPVSTILMRMLSREPAARPSMVDVANSLASADGTAAADPYLPPAPPEATRGSSPGASVPAGWADPAPARSGTRAGPDTGPLGALPSIEDAFAEAPVYRRSTWVPVLAAACLLAIVGVLAFVLVTTRDNTTPVAAGGTSTVTTAAPTASTASESASSGASTGTAVGPSDSGSSSAVPTGPLTASEMVAAIKDYYALVPNDLAAGWARLTPRYQSNTGEGLANYRAYWHKIRRVVVADARATQGHVLATLTYFFKNGHVVTERDVFTLKRANSGVVKISGSRHIDSHAGR